MIQVNTRIRVGPALLVGYELEVHKHRGESLARRHGPTGTVTVTAVSGHGVNHDSDPSHDNHSSYQSYGPASALRRPVSSMPMRPPHWHHQQSGMCILCI